MLQGAPGRLEPARLPIDAFEPARLQQGGEHRRHAGSRLGPGAGGCASAEDNASDDAFGDAVVEGDAGVVDETDEVLPSVSVPGEGLGQQRALVEGELVEGRLELSDEGAGSVCSQAPPPSPR